MFVANVVHLAQSSRERFVVVRQLREHVQRFDILRVIVQNALRARNLTDRATPTKKDLEAVAAKLLGMRWNMSQPKWNMTGAAPHPDFVRMVVGYALTCKMRLPAVAGTIEEARYQARKAGRPHVVATDIRTALLDYQIPSDEALQKAFQSDKPSVRPAVTLPSSIDPILQRRCNVVATAVQ